jgi:predicted Ser/Thr protein kinase
VHATTKLLKKDIFGEVWLRSGQDCDEILRDTRVASVMVRPLARWLMRREARALAALAGIDGVPALIAIDSSTLRRSYIDGMPMQAAKPRDPAYFRNAAQLLRRLHRAGVAHNDLAKEPNLLVTAGGAPAFIDFQLAAFYPRRGRLFRLLGREDIRHLLKHKRTYCPSRLTRREKQILDTPSALSRVYMNTFKPVYLFVTRRLLGWADREGADDRGARR